MLNPVLSLALVCLAGLPVQAKVRVNKVAKRPCLKNIDGTVYDFSAPDFWGSKNISLSDYKDKFGLQEPGANATEIMNGINHVRPGNGFEPNFQLFSKVDVNGEREHPLFTFLKSHCPPTRDGFSSKGNLFYDTFRNWDIRWNWEKFLIDRDGKPVMRFDPSSEPIGVVEPEVSKMLEKSL